MSFDPITLALAKPKKIDLTKYIPSSSASFNDIVLGLFTQGGGTYAVTDDTTFWADVNTDKPVRFAFTLSDTTKCEAGARSAFSGFGDVFCIDTTFAMAGEKNATVTVIFATNDFVTTNIVVVVEPLTIPSV